MGAVNCEGWAQRWIRLAFPKRRFCEGSQNHGMLWVGRDQVQRLCSEQGRLQPDRVSQSPVQPGLDCFQGWSIDHLSGQPVPVPHHPHGKEFLPYISLKLPSCSDRAQHEMFPSGWILAGSCPCVAEDLHRCWTLTRVVPRASGGWIQLLLLLLVRSCSTKVLAPQCGPLLCKAFLFA